MKNRKASSNLLIWLCWLMYTVSYFGKVNYSANIAQMVDAFHITKAEAGLAQTFFFFAYGVGQVVNGLLCKKYNIKWTVFTSLVISAVLNFVVGITPTFAIVKWLWLINGLSLSMLWPLLIRALSEFVSRKSLDRANVITNTAVASGTLAIYGISAIYATFGGFRCAFYTATAADLIVAVIWLFSYGKAVGRAKQEKDLETAEIVANCTEDAAEETMHPRLLKAAIIFVCIFAVGVNLIKDGLTTWVPSILKEAYSFSDSLAVFLTLLLPLISIFGVPLMVFAHKKIPDYVSLCVVGFAVIGGIVAVIMWSLYIGAAFIMLGGLLIASLIANGLNSVVGGIFPVNMRKMANSGMLAGVLNGFCYLGSTISSYGLGYIADQRGWMAVFGVLLAFCVFACLCWTVYLTLKKIIAKT